MKKFIAALALVMVIVLSLAPMAFAAGLEIEGITPKDGKTGLQINNLAIKVKFNEEVSNPANDAANVGKISILDEEGNKVDVSYVIAHSEKATDELWYIVEGNLASNTKYTVKLDKGIVANSGNALASEYTSTFNTRNTKIDSTISMVIMVGMMVVMFLATSKATKKAAANADPKAIEKAREDALNPYKIAKEKDISLEEAKAIVAKEKEKIKKEQDKIEAERQKREAAKQAEIEALEKQIEEEIAAQRAEYVFKVKEPASIKRSGREVPKAVIKIKKKRAEEKAAKKKAEEAARQERSKGKKSKK